MVIAGLINGLFEKKEVYKKVSNIQFLKKDFSYKIIGIKYIKWLVSKTIWKKANPQIKSKAKPKLNDLIVLRHEMTKAEISHLIAFVLVIIFSFFIWKRFNAKFMIILIMLNILFNLYPALLQQFNKKRIDKLIELKTK